jgi:DNA-binding NarL/FixJ family response regulator
VIAKIEWHPGELFPRMGFIVTHMPMEPDSVVRFYNQHGTTEQHIKEGKYAFRWPRLSCKRFRNNEGRLKLHALAYNLATFLRCMNLPEAMSDWSLTSLQLKLFHCLADDACISEKEDRCPRRASCPRRNLQAGRGRGHWRHDPRHPCRNPPIARAAVMCMTAKLPASERKRQDRSVLHAEKPARPPLAANDFRFLKAPMGAWTSKHAVMGSAGLTGTQAQAILALLGTPLAECRLSLGNSPAFYNFEGHVKILLADDQELVRDTIALFLRMEPGMEVELAADFPAALALVRQGGSKVLILLDYMMPGMNGLAGLAAMRAATPGTPVAILSGIAQRGVAEQALAAGAAGFLPKTMSAKSLIAAIRFMIAGEIYAPMAMLTERMAPSATLAGAQLTVRETEVLRLLCQGLANKEIARELDLQEVTVKLHVKTLYRKIDARNRTHAAMLAKEAGLF